MVILKKTTTLSVLDPETICCHTRWKSTLVGSCFTHPAESLYAPVEYEALAVTDALDEVRYFVRGSENFRC